MPQLRGIHKPHESKRKDGVTMDADYSKLKADYCKQAIERSVGIPAALLTGETEEENMAQAKALLAYQRECNGKRPKSNSEQFAEWMNGGADPAQDEATKALTALEEELRVRNGGYPMITDSGEVTGLPDGRSTAEQFAEWFGNRTAFDPLARGGGWQRLV